MHYQPFSGRGMTGEDSENNLEPGHSKSSSWWNTLQAYLEEAVNDDNQCAQEDLNLREQIEYANQSNSGLVPEAFREDVSRVSNTEKRRSTQSYKSEQEMYAMLCKLEQPSCCTMRLREIYHCLTNHCCNFDVKVFYEKPILWHTPAATLQIGFLIRENVLGIIAGLIIGFMAFAVFVMSFGHAPHIATLASCYVMLFAVFGISFSQNVRCVFMLILPYLLAGRTRWLLMVYATALTTMGPGLNFMHNSGNFRNAIGCVLGQVNTNLRLLDKITEAPMSLFGRQVKNFIQNANENMQRIRNLLGKIKLSLLRVTRVMKTKNSWIKTLIAACGDETAMKNQCLAFFNALYFNCLATMQPAGFVCKLVRMFAEQSCKSVKGMNDICERQGHMLHSQVNGTTPVSQEQIEESEAALLNLIGRKNVSMESGELVDVDLSSSLSNKEQITTMIEEKMDVLFDALDAFKHILSWFLVAWTLLTVAQLVLQAALFRRNWLKKIHFDNCYLTPAFIRQEKHALENQLIMTLPLSFREKRHYVPLSSFWWSTSEKRAAFSSFIFILVGILTIIMVMLADYTMYVVLVTTGPAFSSDFGTKGRKDQYLNAIPEFGKAPEDKIQPKIEGNSSMASLARSLLALSNPLKDIAFDVDASVCRPKASPPSTLHNGLIGAAIIGMLTTIIFQVYVMRLRHVILGWYYPQRETDRAGWLRAYIRNSRGLFSRLVHRFRTRDLNTKRGQARLPFFERYLLTHPDTLWLLGFVGVERVYCVYCGDYGKPNKKVEFEEKFIQCSDCGAYYCLSCQVDLKHICMNCRIPLKILKVEVDLEKMSSEEELEYFCGKHLKRAPHENFRVPPEELDYETMMREYEKMWKSWREANAARMNQQEDLSSEGSSEESNTEMDAPGSVIEDRYIGQPVDVTKPFPIASTHKEMPDKGVEAQSGKTNNDIPARALPLPSYGKAMTPSEHSVSSQNVPAHVELANISFPITSPHTEIPDKGGEAQSGKTNDNIPPRSLPLPSYSKAMTPSEHSVSSQNVPAHVEPANIVDDVASPHTEIPDKGGEAQSGKTNDNIPPRSLPLPSYSKAVTPGERSVSDQKTPVYVDSPNRLSNGSKRDKNAGTRVSVASILSSGVSEHVIEKPYAAHVTTIEPQTSKIYEHPQRPASQAPVIRKEFSSLSTDIARAPETNRRLSKRKEKYAVHAESGRPRKRSQMGSSNEERDKKPPSSQQRRVENKEITNTFTVRGGMPETGSQHTRKVPISSELPPIEHRNTLYKEDKRLLKLGDRAKKLSEKDFDENDMEVDNAFEDPMLDLELPELDRKRTAGRTERDTERDFKVTSVFDENDMEVDTAMQDSALMRAIESDGFYDKKLSRTRSRVTERKMRTAKINQKGPQFDAVFDEDDMSVDDVMNDPRLFADVPDDGLFKEGISDSFLREDL